MRIKEQEIRLTLHEHDDVNYDDHDDDYDDHDYDDDDDGTPFLLTFFSSVFVFKV